MTEFISRNYANDAFEIIIKTDSKEHYKAAEAFARRLIDHAKPVTDNNVGYNWIPVTERLPDNNVPVLVVCENTTIQGGRVRHIGSLDSEKYWFLKTKPDIASFPFHEWKVTHWLPLPELPKEEA